MPYYNRKKLIHGMLCANKKAPGTVGINLPSQTLNIVLIIIGRNSFTIVLYGALSERVYFIFKFS